jgi:DNA-binding PadR family transcriptional regulator
VGRNFPHIKGLLLDYLSRHGEMTGYSFLRYCQQEGMPVSNGTVYPHLRHLEDHGIISARSDGRKRVYTLTGKGTAIVRLHETKPPELRTNLIHFLHVLGTADWNRPENIEKLRGYLGAMDRELRHVASRDPEPPEGPRASAPSAPAWREA